MSAKKPVREGFNFGESLGAKVVSHRMTGVIRERIALEPLNEEQVEMG